MVETVLLTQWQVKKKVVAVKTKGAARLLRACVLCVRRSFTTSTPELRMQPVLVCMRAFALLSVRVCVGGIAGLRRHRSGVATQLPPGGDPPLRAVQASTYTSIAQA